MCQLHTMQCITVVFLVVCTCRRTCESADRILHILTISLWHAAVNPALLCPFQTLSVDSLFHAAYFIPDYPLLHLHLRFYSVQMSAKRPPVVPRKPSGVRVMMPPGEQLSISALPVYRDTTKENGGSGETNHASIINTEREVEILNHCFDDVERFMARLQQAAEAQSVLNQRTKKRNRKSKKKEVQDGERCSSWPVS